MQSVILGNHIKHNKTCLVSGSSLSPNGSAIFSDKDSFPEIIDNIILYNISESSGHHSAYGAISIAPLNNSKTIKLHNNLIGFNAATGSSKSICGGALHVGGASIEINGCTFYGNHSDAIGGAMYIVGFDNDTTDISNCIFWGNTTGNSSSDISFNGSQASVGGYRVTISYSDLEKGSAGVETVPNVVLNWGSGMIDANPLLVNVSMKISIWLNRPVSRAPTTPAWIRAIRRSPLSRDDPKRWREG